MSQSAGAVRNGLVLRFFVPASGALRAVASDLAAKVAEQLGANGEGRAAIKGTLDDLARRVGVTGDDEVAFEFHKLDRELKIEARSNGRASEARIPLPD
jgi:hypothetical protein